MIEYESLQLMYEFLVMPKISKRHWNDNLGWTIGEIHAINVDKGN